MQFKAAFFVTIKYDQTIVATIQTIFVTNNTKATSPLNKFILLVTKYLLTKYSILAPTTMFIEYHYHTIRKASPP